MPIDPAIEFLPFDMAEVAARLVRWQSDGDAVGVLALVPEAQRARVPALQALCRERAVPLCGAVFPALLHGGAFHTEGVCLLRLSAPVPQVLLSGLGHGPQSAAHGLGEAVDGLLRDLPVTDVRPTLFLCFDAMVPNIASILDALYLSLADRVSYAGVNAGSETFQPMPCLFDGDRVVGDGVLALLLPGQVGTVLAHGYPVPERSMTATATSGNQVISIDWRPAFDVYQEVIGNEYGIALTRANFYQHAVHFPFGIVRANAEVVVRIPVGLTDDGGLYCVGEVPENAVLVLLRAPAANAGSCIAQLASGLGGRDGPRQHSDLLAFYCAGRRMHLTDAAAGELAQLQDATGARAVTGALSLGEIGSVGGLGYPIFHNAALVCRPWP